MDFATADHFPTELTLFSRPPRIYMAVCGQDKKMVIACSDGCSTLLVARLLPKLEDWRR
jgi:hypothetical protein